MVLKSDGEPSITALVTAVQKEWLVTVRMSRDS